MRPETKSLISKIESLSSQMNPQQLKEFLDVLDSMALMIEEAAALPTTSEEHGLKELKLALH